MNSLRVTPPGIDKRAFEIKRNHIYTLRFTPPEIDKHTFEIRNPIYTYTLRLRLIMIVFMVWALALIFMQWSSVLTTNTADVILNTKGAFTMGSKDHGDAMPHQVTMDGYSINKYEASNVQRRDFIKATPTRLQPIGTTWINPVCSSGGCGSLGSLRRQWNDLSLFL